MTAKTTKATITPQPFAILAIAVTVIVILHWLHDTGETEDRQPSSSASCNLSARRETMSAPQHIEPSAYFKDTTRRETTAGDSKLVPTFVAAEVYIKREKLHKASLWTLKRTDGLSAAR